MNIKYITALLASSLLAFSSCSDDKDDTSNPISPEDKPTEQPVGKAYGADISWITAQEAKGVKFYNEKGSQSDMFSLLKVMGGNTVRFRVWVNPSNDPYSGYCDKADVLAKCKRAKAAGLRIMIDFHYSDSWADPSKQNKPAAWKSYTVDQLTDAVATHTTDVLSTLKAEGIDVEWVQVGNETRDGMLWEEGRCSKNPKNYAAFTKAGAEAAKKVYPNVKVIVHIDNGWAYWTPEWIVDQLKARGVHSCYDVIGISYYPSEMLKEESAKNDFNILTWEDGNKTVAQNITKWINKYQKKVMVVEYGYTNSKLAEAQSILTDLMSRTKDIEDFEGILMWEPQSYNGWAGYGLGLFTKDGRPGVVFK
ncbi:MAG: glycosyl hydrolase 53 family protein [Bacteroidia bacterium]|nr:glycosyl hydrolase 53 family protein [Bacteroidia bacterium]